MLRLRSAPTPEKFATVWEQELEKAVATVTSSGRIGRAQAERIGDDKPAQRIFRDNVLKYLDARHVRTTSTSRLFASGYQHALQEGKKAAGTRSTISLTAARQLAKDLVDDFFVLRGKTPPSGTAPAGKSTSDVLGALDAAILSISDLWDSGDNGVNVTASKLPAQSLAGAMIAAPQQPETPWTHAEGHLALGGVSGPDAVEAFTGAALDAMSNFKGETTPEMTGFADAVKSAFAGLSDVRIASGADLGGTYLLGKTTNGWAVMTVQAYSDG